MAKDNVILHLKTLKSDPMHQGVNIELYANQLPLCPAITLAKHLEVQYTMTIGIQAPLFVGCDMFYILIQFMFALSILHRVLRVLIIYASICEN